MYTFNKMGLMLGVAPKHCVIAWTGRSLTITVKEIARMSLLFQSSVPMEQFPSRLSSSREPVFSRAGATSILLTYSSRYCCSYIFSVSKIGVSSTDKHVVVASYPPHTTHKLQNLDVIPSVNAKDWGRSPRQTSPHPSARSSLLHSPILPLQPRSAHLKMLHHQLTHSRSRQRSKPRPLWSAPDCARTLKGQPRHPWPS